MSTSSRGVSSAPDPSPAELLPDGSPPSAALEDARFLLAEHREREAIDALEGVASDGPSAVERAVAAGHLATLLLAGGRPAEAAEWLHVVREGLPGDGWAEVLEAAALVQMERAGEALDRLDAAPEIRDPTLAGAETLRRLVRAAAFSAMGRPADACSLVEAVIRDDPRHPDAWAALASVLDGDRVDLATLARLDALVALVPDDAVTEVLAWSSRGPVAGAVRVLEAIHRRWPGDLRVLAAAAELGPTLDTAEALRWSERLRAAGLHEQCPLRTRAADASRLPRDRALAAAVLTVAFDDEWARETVEAVAADVPDSLLADTARLVLDLAPEAADSFVAGAAHTRPRALALANVLAAAGAIDEAVVTARYGLVQLGDDEHLDDDAVDALEPALRDALVARAVLVPDRPGPDPDRARGPGDGADTPTEEDPR